MIDSVLLSRVIDLAIEIQQIPAPTFSEGRRSAFMQSIFESEGLADVESDALGNVFGRIPGCDSGPPIILTAHLDTVFPESTDLSYTRNVDRITGPGIGDNALGLAGLLGLFWLIRDHKKHLNHDTWLVANVGEEGLGNLRGMQAVVSRFQGDIKAYLVLEGMALGQVYHRGLGVQRMRISARTAGGHSWVEAGRPSAIHELIRLASRMLSWSLPTQPRTTLNIGIFQGGTSINTIAPFAYFDLDLRSESTEILTELAEKISNLVLKYRSEEVQLLYEMIGTRPPGEIPLHHPLVVLAGEALMAVGITPNYNIGSTDANVPLSRGYPAICLGLTTGHGAHTLNETIEIAPLGLGLQQLFTLIERLDTDKM